MSTRPARRARAPEFDAWDAWYQRQDYRRMPWYSARPSPWLVEAVQDRAIPPAASVLDVGCGTGTNAMWLALRGFRTAAVDVSPTAVRIATERAARRGANVDFRVAGADRLPFGRGQFGAAVDTGCFHSLPSRLRVPYARELARVVRPGGLLLLTWIPREVRTALGPPHRPSLAEVANVFEPGFVFRAVDRHDSDTPRGWAVAGGRIGRCTARLVRRRGAQPPVW